MTENEQILLGVIHSLCTKRSDNIRKIYSNAPDSYPYIPISINLFFKTILSVKERLKKEKSFDFNGYNPENEKPTFMDYGAGIGVTMHIAKLLGFLPYGIEISQECLNESYFYNPSGRSFLEKLDLTDESTFLGRSYDIVYYYSPFSTNEKEIQFELNAIKTVKIGGYVIAPPPGRLREYIINYKNKYEFNLPTVKNYRTEFYNKMKNFEEVEEYVFKRIK